MRLTRRSLLAAAFPAPALPAEENLSHHVMLRSTWQTVNVGDIAHTPGMPALPERHLPETMVTLWPDRPWTEVERMLLRRFPKVRVASTVEEQNPAMSECDFGLHGSGPGLVGWRELLAGARFVFCRDTVAGGAEDHRHPARSPGKDRE